MSPDPAAILPVLERYYDTAPRATCDVEAHGPLSLFVARLGFPYYARPRLGSGPVGEDELRVVLERQRVLDVPRALEWVHETKPSLLATAHGVGMSVEECPLLVLEGDPPAPRTLSQGLEVRLVEPDDPDLLLVWAAVTVGFGTQGTAVGTVSSAERDAEAAARPDAGDRIAALVRSGLSVFAGAFDGETGPVGGGSHNPRGEVTEVVGVAVLPAFRRRGLAAALTTLLARDAVDRGATTVFCSAQDDDVARVYESLGFRRVGTACIAEAA